MKLLYTSDLHSYLFPTSFTFSPDQDMGVYRIAASMQKDSDSLYIDGGDSLQGAALSKYVLENNITEPFPQAAAFRTMGLDIAVPGNHDFNFGHDAFCKFFLQTGAKVLCANLNDLSGQLEIHRHLVLESEGIRIGFTGLVTDYVNLWEKRENLEGFQILDARRCAEQELAWLKEHCDFCVLVYHGGFESNLATGERLSKSRENIAYELAVELDYDLILTGHQHMQIPLQKVGHSFVIQAGANARAYAELQIGSDGTISGGLRNPISGESIMEIQNHELRTRIESWLDTPLGEISEAIPAPTQLQSALRGSRIADFFNTVQLAATGADISCTSLANELYGFEKILTIRQIIASYQYSNSLLVLEIDEKQLREALEHCASFFELDNGRPVISSYYLKPKVELYNYDYYLNLDYQFDLSKPVGSRVTRLLFRNKPIEGKLRLALNNYRATGTGGYEVFSSCKVERQVYKDVQDMSIEYLQKNKDSLSWPKASFSCVGFDLP